MPAPVYRKTSAKARLARKLGAAGRKVVEQSRAPIYDDDELDDDAGAVGEERTALDAYEELCGPGYHADADEDSWDPAAAGWLPSKKKNLYRTHAGLTLTIFGFSDGFKWSIADPDEVRYSRHVFGRQVEAASDLWEEVETWGPR